MSDISPLFIGLPFRQEATGGATNGASTTMSALNSAIGAAVSIRLKASLSSETITKVGYRQTTTTGTPAANSYRIGLQGINIADGNPDGTWLGGGSPAYVDFTPSNANDGKWVWMTLSNSISVNRGDFVSVVLQRTAATDAANCISAYSSEARSSQRVGFPTAHTNNGTVWTAASAAHSTLGYASSTNLYLFAAENLYILSTFGNTTEAGITFTVPTSYCSTFKLLGVRWWGLTGVTSTKKFMATIYSNPTTGSITIISQSNQADVAFNGAQGSADRETELYFADATLPTLSAGTKYGIGLSCTTASSMDIAGMTLTSASDAAAWAHSDLGIAFTSRTLTDFPPSGNDTNNFAAETTTKWPYIELIVGDLVMPAGGGGSSMLVHPGMVGGCRG